MGKTLLVSSQKENSLSLIRREFARIFANYTRNARIELEFIGPKPGNDGSYPVEKASAISGQKLLRNVMADNKIELYATYGKVMNCGGVGNCGTCIVEIINGKEFLNKRTKTELRYLKKKPESWRLACQTIVLEIKKTLARLWFRGFPSGRND